MMMASFEEMNSSILSKGMEEIVVALKLTGFHWSNWLPSTRWLVFVEKSQELH